MSSGLMYTSDEIDLDLFDFNPLDSFELLTPMQVTPNPYVKIVKQPKLSPRRFRHRTEEERTISIVGINTTPSNRTFPIIQVINYRGSASVVVSCVFENPPYRQHPHKLVGAGCENGVCTLRIPEESMSVTFSNLEIQCSTTRRTILESLRLREILGIDPFENGFSHASEIEFQNVRRLRLCFQVYLERDGNRIALNPVISNPIFYKELPNRLVIVKLSKCVSPADGSKEDIMMFCNEVDRCDIQIKFQEKVNNRVVWEDFGLFTPGDVHKRFGISFKAPPYKDLHIKEPVKVFIQLKRPSDGFLSEKYSFEYHPIARNSDIPTVVQEFCFFNEFLRSGTITTSSLVDIREDSTTLTQPNNFQPRSSSNDDLMQHEDISPWEPSHEEPS